MLNQRMQHSICCIHDLPLLSITTLTSHFSLHYRQKKKIKKSGQKKREAGKAPRKPKLYVITQCHEISYLWLYSRVNVSFYLMDISSTRSTVSSHRKSSLCVDRRRDAGEALVERNTPIHVYACELTFAQRFFSPLPTFPPTSRSKAEYEVEKILQFVSRPPHSIYTIHMPSGCTRF